MVRNSTILASVACLALIAGAATAGDYHRLTSLVCSDCHTMHYSVSHNFGNGNTPPPTNLSGGPNQKLLKAATPNDLCKSCHDGQNFAPDTFGANTGNYVRESGGITTGTAPYENWKGHTLGADSAGVVAPGGTYNTGATGLQCTSCHSAHGGASGLTYTDLADPVTAAANGQWRNLSSKPGGISTPVRLAYVKGVNDPKADIFEHDGTLGQVSTHYDISNVDFNEPDPTQSSYGNWCKGCHTQFHGLATDANMHGSTDWVRHPTAGVNLSSSSITRYNSLTNKVKVLKGTAANDYTPSCFTCHKAHGNQNAFGLIYMKGTGTVTEEGDDGTQLPNLCQQCHTQGT